MGMATAEKLETTTTMAVSAPVGAAAAPEVQGAKGPKKSKKGKKVAEAAKEEENANNIATIDHPYLSFLHKRIRLYKKKMEKVRALELACAQDGKVLNEQQEELVAQKVVNEKMVAEFEALREQFIGVYLQEEAEKTKQAEVEAVVSETAATAEAVAEEPTEETAQPETKDEFALVAELLKPLHVVAHLQSLQKDVPLVLDFFSKVLLGRTRPPMELSFEENLAESLEEARKYLTGSDKIVACDVSYAHVKDLVNHLAGRSSSTATEPSETNPADEDVTLDSDDAAVSVEDVSQEQSEVEAADAIPTPTPEEEPHINFFTDVQVEGQNMTTENAAVEESVSDDKVNDHEAAPEEVEISGEDEAEPAKVEEAVPVTAPPKSFAAAAAAAPAIPPTSAWNKPLAGPARQPAATRSPSPKSDDQQREPRRRSNEHWKQKKSNGNNDNAKPRRPRQQRTDDDTKRSERRPRGDRQPRKQQSHGASPAHREKAPAAA